VSVQARKYRFLPLIVLALVVLLAGSCVYWMVHNFLNSAPAATKKVAQEIHVIRPPPPPPEAPPPPPPPPEEKVDVHEPQPEPDPTPSNEPPPSEQLGLDAEGGAGGDAFGLVGNKGGRDLLASGGSAFAWYAGLLKNEILEQLQSDVEIRKACKGSSAVNVQVWIGADGTTQRTRSTQSSGDRACDKAVESMLSRIKHMPQAPPADMPQPISLRIVSHL